MKNFLKSVIFFMSVLMVSSTTFAEMPALRTLSAVVKMVDVQASKIFVDFTHPATDETLELELLVNRGTGFKGFESLAELTPNSAVQVDYEKTPEGSFAKRIVLVQLAGAHPDLVGFTPMSLVHAHQE